MTDPFFYIGLAFGVFLSLFYILDQVGLRSHSFDAAAGKAAALILEGLGLVQAVKVFAYLAWQPSLDITNDERAIVAVGAFYLSTRIVKMIADPFRGD